MQVMMEIYIDNLDLYICKQSKSTGKLTIIITYTDMTFGFYTSNTSFIEEIVGGIAHRDNFKREDRVVCRYFYVYV